ncbi:FAD-dependent oxidoreductase [Desulfotalea psychrophila]|uniref:Related to mercuric reductase n=1 Tax=Desulfotalea psychrophila (strain LSv54 / DSM 12343) TaxID=177439 RepID=Q6AQZ1_DESPS|nr:bifunctional TVP38/TMEM64 family protein/FAD-dependent oxidoreductase [Desulfotalea psychrophila]CAG35233.1 related to mercuric reductase [Desulfotalea psychrophila LSv54]
MKKYLIVGTVIALVSAYYFFGLDSYLSLQAIKTRQVQLESWRNAEPILAGLSFFGLYAVVASLSLPGAGVLTVAAGAIFGLIWGVLIVSFASTLGASLAFLLSRFLLREIVQSRFQDRLHAVNRGMEEEGAFYLFTLRLVPIFPFFVINLLMGLTSIRLRTFAWVSQLGMLVGTIVYVNAGTQLAQVESLGGILSTRLLFSFALLGIFPLICKRGIAWFKGRRLYAKWLRPARFDRNLIVIGAGAAGLVSAYIATTLKAKVTLVEAAEMGGDCLNYGCVPSKALIKSAKVAHHIRNGDKYGLDAVELSFSFRRVMARVHRIIATIEPHDSVERYTDLGVEVLCGYARLLDPWTVEVKLKSGETRRLTSRAVIIATGAGPFIPPLPGLDAVDYLTNETLWNAFANLDEAPRRLLVLGGGPIGCELSQALARLGSEVWQIQRGARLLPREDADAAAIVEASLGADGVHVLTGHTALRCERAGEEKYIVVEHEGQELRLAFDALICAVGRVARLKGYGLEELGIPVKRTVLTNEYLQTLYPNIFAAGDVAGPYQFTHTAAHQAWYAVVNALFGGIKKFKVDYSVIPWTTFVDPEVARVGLNEQEAAERGVDVEVTRYDLDDLDRAITDGVREGFIKILTVPNKDRILGVTIVGEHAGDLLAEFVLAMKHGLGLNKILSTIHTYPTLAEANKYAAGGWKRKHLPRRLLAWAERYHSWRRL